MEHPAFASEHLKEYVRGIIYAFKDGAGHPSAPFTAELAVAAIWHEIDRAFEEEYAGPLKGTLRFRLEVKRGTPPPEFIDVVTCRCLGDAGNDKQVYYVVCRAPNYEEAAEIVQRFGANGQFIRDWKYYGS